MSGQYLQLCDNAGQPISRKVDRDRVGRDGILHLAAHLWLWRRDTNGNPQILLQKRAEDKSTWPGYWDISAAGHVDYGETVVDAAVREAQEEVGLAIGEDDLKLLFVHRYNQPVPDSPYIENEVRWVYTCEVPFDTELDLIDGEVDKVQWLDIDSFYEWTNEPGVHRLVNQLPDYFFSLRYGLGSVVEDNRS